MKSNGSLNEREETRPDAKRSGTRSAVEKKMSNDERDTEGGDFERRPQRLRLPLRHDIYYYVIPANCDQVFLFSGSL